MPMRTVQTSFGKIAYRESTGSGIVVLLLHGNSASSGAFTHQIEGSLGRRYRLIAPDLPGHGQSDDATDPAIYCVQDYARMLLEFVAALGIGDAVFVGWSLGGHIVLQAAPDLPNAKGFVIFGTPPLAFPPEMEQAFLPHPAMEFTFAQNLNEQQARAYVAAAFRPGVIDLPPSMIADVVRTDGRARAQLMASSKPFRDQVEVVANLKQPLAVLHGAQEQLVNAAYFETLKMPTLWRGNVQSIEGAGHAPQWEQPEKFDALIEAFVEDTR